MYGQTGFAVKFVGQTNDRGLLSTFGLGLGLRWLAGVRPQCGTPKAVSGRTDPAWFMENRPERHGPVRSVRMLRLRIIERNCLRADSV